MAPDSILLGGYQLGTKLREDVFDTTYAATAPTGQQCEVHVLKRDFESFPAIAQSWTRAAQAIATNRGRSLPQIHKASIDRGRSFYASGPEPKNTLASHLARTPVNDDAAASIARSVAQALDAAHKAGVTSWDLRPEAVGFDERGVASLRRWLLKDPFSTAARPLPDPTPYLAPEGITVAAPCADVYALGVLLLRLIAGRDPTQQELQRGVVPAGLTRELANTLQRCLQREPQHRFGSAAEVAAALTSIEPTMIVPPPLMVPAVEPAPPEPYVAPLAARSERSEWVPHAAPPPPAAIDRRTKRTNGRSPRIPLALAIGSLVAGLAVGVAAAGAAWWFLIRDDENGNASASSGGAAATAQPPSSPPIAGSPPVQATPPVLPTRPASLAGGRPYAAIIHNLETFPCANVRVEPAARDDVRVIDCLTEGQPVAINGDARVTNNPLFPVWWNVTAQNGKTGWVESDALLLSTRTIPVNAVDRKATTTFHLNAIDITPDGELVLQLAFANTSGSAVDWDSDADDLDEVYLVDDLGRRVDSLEVGGSFGKDLPSGLPGRTTLYGWHLFSLADPNYRGGLTLHYPLRSPITFQLTGF